MPMGSPGGKTPAESSHPHSLARPSHCAGAAAISSTRRARSISCSSLRPCALSEGALLSSMLQRAPGEMTMARWKSHFACVADAQVVRSSQRIVAGAAAFQLQRT